MRVYDGMPSFLNPLETIVGGIVDIPIGSKWVRAALYWGSPDVRHDYFLGQEVEITRVTPEVVYFIAFSTKGAKHHRVTVTSKKNLELHFQPLNISLENK